MSRSVAVTKLLNSLEESMFELTSKASSLGQSNYSNQFNTPEAFRLFTGINNKGSIGNESFKYPDEDSYIILPRGWVNVINNEEVSFLGMSIDSQHVNPVFPNNIR